MKRILIVLVVALLLVSNGFAKKQGQDLIDSILTELPIITEDTSKVEAYRKLSYALYPIDPIKGLKYGKQGYKLAKKINWEPGEAACLVQIGTNYGQLSNYDKSVKSYKEAIEIFDKMDQQASIAKTYSNMGYLYDIQSDFSNALIYYFKALDVYENLDSLKETAITLNSIGVVYDLQSEYGKALNYYHKALKIFEEIENKYGVAQAVGNIGVVYQIQEEFDKALDYYIKALKIYEELGKEYGVSINLGNIGMVYRMQKEYDKSLDYYLKALKINKKLKNKSLLVDNTTNIGTLYRLTGRYEESLEYYKKALEISKKIDDKYCNGRSYGNLGIFYLELAKDSVRKLYPNNHIIKENSPQVLLGRAVNYLTESISYVESIGADNEVQEFQQYLSDAYALQEDYKNAYETYKSHTILKDSIFNIDKQKAIANLEAKRENELNQKEIEILKQENKFKTKISYYLWILIGMVVVILSILFFLYRNKKKSNVNLAQKNELIEQANIELGTLNSDLAEKNYEISYAHQKITDSIEYAEKIQTAMLPSDKTLTKLTQEYFLMYRPKDIVSGDFYWVTRVDGIRYFASVDCTGHGVPGAFMSIIGNDLLDQIIKERKISSPAQILEELNAGVRTALHQKDAIGSQQDGMDLVLVKIDGNKIQFAGARRPIWYTKDGRLQKIQGNRQSIGGRMKKNRKPFVEHTIEMDKDMQLYLFSDGITDQNGPEGNMFGNKRLWDIIEKNMDQPMEIQNIQLTNAFDEFIQDEDMRDDISFIAIKP